ncbi:hypothetical protein [Prauserella muralis]|uniref:hypothetical protein n=1 Tax=Prauserella muralis TaxID=588067 RepID=UPI000DD4A0EB|nr:hypothetical protein [Prauserella muralis]TWE13675.1 hypothetical protein FHX69_5800 [Prauserella muralis]
MPVVLGGASAFIPVPVSAQDYAAYLGRRIIGGLAAEPEAELSAALADAIEATAHELGLKPGRSPSSTVSILRQRPDRVGLLALGDSVIVLPGEVVTDERIDGLRLAQRDEYRRRLAAGSGYDDRHRELLRQLQTEQAERRNVEGGYWIAEAEPKAAEHALQVSRPASAVRWAVLATDGAYTTMTRLRLDDWPQVAEANETGLAALLDRCQVWEPDVDPDGRQLPRAKRHDDKTIAAVHLDHIPS